VRIIWFLLNMREGFGG
jgi:hypothetical protein